MDYQQLKVTCAADQTEVLMALFSAEPFDTFEENETGFAAYMPIKDWTASTQQNITDICQRFDCQYDTHLIKYQNWNEIWESNFEAMQVDDFCGIRADFHAPIEGVEHEIVINPKMAFGTGHHSTTYMVMKLMRDIPFTDRKVFDYGCGTGILAILAAYLGSPMIDAVDIELPSYENTIENSAINGVTCSPTAPYNGVINAYHGILDDVPAAKYEVILANINRNVILQSLPALFDRLLPGGDLLISGFILADETLMAEAVAKHGFIKKHTERRENWLCMHLTK